MKIIYKNYIYETTDNPIVGGIGDNFEDYDPDQMRLGIEVEKEHIKNNPDLSEDEIRIIARDIAKDHLKEIPDYYTRLVKMEKSAKAK